MEPEAPRFNYDVFLSFRGSDTRQGFASVLYDHMVKAGIRVFKDDGELKAGDKIETVLEAINNSEICVPIFSKNFASSKWCLEEVKRMVHLEKAICPVFYGVSVEDVKLKTQTYNKIMQKLETNNEQNMDEWKDALKAATDFKGKILGNQRYVQCSFNFIIEMENLLLRSYRIPILQFSQPSPLIKKTNQQKNESLTGKFVVLDCPLF